jgi:hypothetical protein
MPLVLFSGTMIPNAAVLAMKQVLADKDVAHEDDDEVCEIKRETGDSEEDVVEVKVPERKQTAKRGRGASRTRGRGRGRGGRAPRKRRKVDSSEEEEEPESDSDVEEVSDDSD